MIGGQPDSTAAFCGQPDNIGITARQCARSHPPPALPGSDHVADPHLLDGHRPARRRNPLAGSNAPGPFEVAALHPQAALGSRVHVDDDPVVQDHLPVGAPGTADRLGPVVFDLGHRRSQCPQDAGFSLYALRPRVGVGGPDDPVLTLAVRVGQHPLGHGVRAAGVLAGPTAALPVADAPVIAFWQQLLGPRGPPPRGPRVSNLKLQVPDFPLQFAQPGELPGRRLEDQAGHAPLPRTSSSRRASSCLISASTASSGITSTRDLAGAS